jgi:predicted nucleotidyltransferase component of viral defense system
VLKGGTSLRLLHVGEFRYSADLDFTVLDGSVNNALQAMASALAAARAHAQFPHLELTDEAKPTIEYVGPLVGKQARRIKLDLSGDEYVESTEQLGIRPLWDDLPEIGLVNVYTLREITAEKLRCMIQRLQCRDLFDLYQLVDELGVDLADVADLFHRKARAKEIDPAIFSQRFDERLPQYRRRWQSEMSVHLPHDLLDIELVIRVVSRHLRKADLLS